MRLRFWARGIERATHDAQEQIAMLNHRLKSIRYWQSSSSLDSVEYYFRDEKGSTAFALFSVGSFQELDWLLKRDPQFPYLDYKCQPVVSTKDLIEEIQDYLGKQYFDSQELIHFEPHPVIVDQSANYVLVYKVQPAFSPLLSETVQNEILVKTVTSQRAHDSTIEISDVNPVGSKIGIHVSRVTSLEEARAPVESTNIFPDTVVTYFPLRTLVQAQSDCVRTLKRFGIVDL